MRIFVERIENGFLVTMLDQQTYFEKLDGVLAFIKQKLEPDPNSIPF